MATLVDKFIQVRKKLQDHAVQAGDNVFADALADCILNVDGGNLDCPLGRLAVERYVADKTLPVGPLEGSDRAPKSNIPVTRGKLIDLTHQFLVHDPAVLHDKRSCEALHECEAFRKSSPLCPLFAVLHQDPSAVKKNSLPE